MPSASAASSFISASNGSFAENLETLQAVTKQQSTENLPDVKEVDDPAKGTAPALSVVDDNNPEDSAPTTKETLDESRPFGAESDTLAYARSLDDTTVSEMTNPTVFQSRPLVEDDAGVLQETSGNTYSDKSATVSTDAEKSKWVSDPFDATSTVFSSGDPFRAPAVQPGGTSMSENTSFNDAFFTSKSQADPFLDAESNDFADDPPLDVVDMASSDEEDGSKVTKKSSRKEQITSKRKWKTPSEKAAKGLKLEMVETKVTESAIDDPPLESVDMDSSGDEASEPKSTVTPAKSVNESATLSPISRPSRDKSASVIALDSPANAILTKVKERKKKIRQEKQEEASVPVGAAVSAGGITERKSESDAVPPLSSSPQRIHPAADAVGRSSSQRARILAKQRKGRMEPAGVSNNSPPRTPQQVETTDTAPSRPTVDKTPDTLKPSRRRIVARSVASGSRGSARTLSQDEVMTPVKPQRVKTYAVERPQSILKKPSRALPAEPSLYMVRQPWVIFGCPSERDMESHLCVFVSPSSALRKH